MLKKILTTTLAAFLTCTAFLAVSCKDPAVKPGGDDGEVIDHSKTQLYVFCFSGGYGSDWLAAAKKRFEEEHKDDVWEEGKKGVQIYIDARKVQISTMHNSILSGTNELYFGESGYYYTLKNAGVLGDITEAVTTDLTEYGETESIEDKMSEEQKSYFGIEENGEKKYYALPHYSGNFGFIYNVDLFEEMGYYFAKTPRGDSLEGRFISAGNPEKSTGPDGKYKTSDDGFPATYEEFFDLCEFIASDGITPINWCGNAYVIYLNWLLASLVADYNGVDQTKLNYTMKGDATELGTYRNGEFVRDSESTEITPSTAYELARQAGRYYGLDFMHRMTMTDKYHYNLVFNTGYTHIDAQEDFINAGYDGVTKEMAMLADGAWWESEATGAFERMVQAKGDKFSKKNRNFAYMPLPKATKEKVEEAGKSDKPYTMLDQLDSICFMKANIAEWKKPLALEFIRFLHTDESLKEYTLITNTLKAFDYTLEESEKAQLSKFGQSLLEIQSRANIVYPRSTASDYINNQTFFDSSTYMTRSTVAGKTYNGWYSAFADSNVTAAEYFNGIYTFYKDNWIA